jgi:hypothetical protein
MCVSRSLQVGEGFMLHGRNSPFAKTLIVNRLQLFDVLLEKRSLVLHQSSVEYLSQDLRLM